MIPDAIVAPIAFEKSSSVRNQATKVIIATKNAEDIAFIMVFSDNHSPTSFIFPFLSSSSPFIAGGELRIIVRKGSVNLSVGYQICNGISEVCFKFWTE